MAGSKDRITFEVQVLQGSGWVTHASYTSEQQGQAIQDAKALEQISTIKSVKVIREETDPNTGNVKENNIFASANLPDEEQPQGKIEAKKAKAEMAAKKAVAESKNKETTKTKKSAKTTPKSSTEMRTGAPIPEQVDDYDPEEDAAPRFSIFGLFIKLLLVVLFSAVIASLIAGLGGVWLRSSSFRPNTQSNILFGLFVGSFAISIFSMGMSFLSKANFGSSRKSKPHKPRPEKPAKAHRPKKPPKEDHVSADFRDEAEKSAQVNKNTTEEEPPKAPEQTAEDKKPETGEDSGVDIESEAGYGSKAPWVEKQQKYVMDYLLDALKESGVDKSKLDNFNKFGVNLFIAGACETLSQERNLDGKTMALVIGEPVKYMGFKRRDAEAFADRIQGYLLADSKYMQAYQAGRSAMKSHFDNDPDAAKLLKQALEEWNKPKEKGESGGPVTVLFTDIAGSTNMTQTLGDAVAQQVVRAHNKIVREALSKFQGKEIKHTGDGIMASFATTSNGVDAAADMQLGTRKHNANNPDLPLGLKIGLNAGEPIAEDNDLFGTTVQLAARIVDKAQANQVFVSDTVFGICSGKKYTFVKRGPFEMKGFDGGLMLHELIWDKDAPQPDPEPIAETLPETPPAELQGGTEIGADIGADLTNTETAEAEPIPVTTEDKETAASPTGEETSELSQEDEPEKPQPPEPASLMEAADSSHAEQSEVDTEKSPNT